MKRRQKLNYSKSKKLFRRNAGTHPRNIPVMPMRGGFRM